MPLRALAILCLIGATLGWGLSFPMIKALLAHQQALSGGDGTWVTLQHQTVRFLGAAVVLMLLARLWRGRLATRAEWAQAAVCGLSAAPGMFLQSAALNYTSASTDGFLTQAYVVVLPLIAALRLRRWPAWTTLAAVVLALGGVGLISGVSLRDLRPGLGEVMVIAASLIFIVQILALEAKRWAGNDGIQVTWAMFAVMTALSLPAAALTGRGLGGIAACYDAPALAVTGVIVLLCSCVPYALMTIWQRRVSSSEAGIIYCSEAVFSAIASLFLPALLAAWLGVDYANEVVGWRMLAGGGLIIAACVLVQLRSPHAD